MYIDALCESKLVGDVYYHECHQSFNKEDNGTWINSINEDGIVICHYSGHWPTEEDFEMVADFMAE